MKNMTKFNFEDGRGSIPAHQHINPDKSIGGWVADSVEISASAEVTVAGEVRISGYYKTVISGGTFRGGEFWSGTFRGGTFWGGTFWGGEFWGGDFRGGTFWDGTFRGGTFRGGEFWSGIFRGGEFWGGEFWGGDFRGGVIRTNRDFIVFVGCGSRNTPLTVQFEDEILLTTGCQNRITLAEFAAKVKTTHGNNIWAQEYRAIIACVKTLAKIRKEEA